MGKISWKVVRLRNGSICQSKDKKNLIKSKKMNLFGKPFLWVLSDIFKVVNVRYQKLPPNERTSYRVLVGHLFFGFPPLGSATEQKIGVPFRKNPINKKKADRILALVRYLAVENRSNNNPHILHEIIYPSGYFLSVFHR